MGFISLGGFLVSCLDLAALRIWKINPGTKMVQMGLLGFGLSLFFVAWLVLTTRPYEQEKFSLSVCVKLMFYALVHVSFCLLKNSWCIYCWDQSIGHKGKWDYCLQVYCYWVNMWNLENKSCKPHISNVVRTGRLMAPESRCMAPSPWCSLFFLRVDHLPSYFCVFDSSSLYMCAANEGLS